jgi:hypothetical protein
MPRPKLPESVVIQRQKDKQRRTRLFQRIKKVFSNNELKILLNYTFYDSLLVTKKYVDDLFNSLTKS